MAGEEGMGLQVGAMRPLGGIKQAAAAQASRSQRLALRRPAWPAPDGNGTGGGGCRGGVLTSAQEDCKSNDHPPRHSWWLQARLRQGAPTLGGGGQQG
jgi:hypothetical protein